MVSTPNSQPKGPQIDPNYCHNNIFSFPYRYQKWKLRLEQGQVKEKCHVVTSGGTAEAYNINIKIK
jgi:hypothetical protein